MIHRMKNSGIEWIGEIPDDWKVERLQWYIEEVKVSNNPMQTDRVLSLTNKAGVIPYEEKGAQGNVAKEDYTQYKLAYPNTIVANSMNILIGSVGICNYFGCVSPVYYVFKPTQKANLFFINYIMQTISFQKELRRYANGILEIRLRVSANGILKRKIAIPSFEKQKRVVDVINKKCAAVERLIENQQKQIEKLKEYKQSIITEAVTKGLDPSVPMKESGCEWIEKIPEKWVIRPLKHLFNFDKGLPITKADLLLNGIKVISYGQIHAKYNKSAFVNEQLYRFVSEKYLTTNTNSLVQKGDFIFADTSEDIEGSGDFVYIDKNDLIFAGYHCITLKHRHGANNKYLAYLFMSNVWKKQIQSRVCGIKVYSISRGMLAKVSVILPVLEEQQKIADYLDKKCAEIDKLISVKQQKIDKLDEYKKSLIYEYVTGKKEVG